MKIRVHPDEGRIEKEQLTVPAPATLLCLPSSFLWLPDVSRVRYRQELLLSNFYLKEACLNLSSRVDGGSWLSGIKCLHEALSPIISAPHI